MALSLYLCIQKSNHYYVMANFLEIKTPVKRDAEWSDWAREMRSRFKAAGIPVRWQMFHYHMTILFLDDDEHVEELTSGFDQRMSTFTTLPLTIDKVDAFTTGNGAEHIICLAATQVPPQILTLAHDARTLADGLNANYDRRPFRPHITLGRVTAEKASLDQLQDAIRTVVPPAFTCKLDEAEHRYYRGDKIKTWKLS